MKCDDMPLEDVKTIIEKLPWSRHISIGGQGEPLISPHEFDVMNYLKGMNKTIDITTNGSPLANDNVCMSVPDNIKAMFISVDAGTQEAYSIYRKANFNIWKNAVLNWRKLRPEVFTQINYLIFQHNIQDIPLMLDFCKGIGARLSCTFPAIFREDVSEAESVWWLQNVPQLIDKYKKYAEFIGVPFITSSGRFEYRKCMTPFYQPIIGIQGDVYTDFYIYQIRKYDKNQPIIWTEWFRDNCKEVPQHEYRMGNLLEQSWAEIWNEGYGPFFIKLDLMNNNPVDSRRFMEAYLGTDAKKEKWNHCYQCGRRWGFAY